MKKRKSGKLSSKGGVGFFGKNFKVPGPFTANSKQVGNLVTLRKRKAPKRLRA